MTYGEASAELRDAVGQLVMFRRVTIHLGAAHGVVRVKANIQEVRANTDLILRYRAVVWDYVVAALRTAVPDPPAPYYEVAARLLGYVGAARPHRDALSGGRAASTLELGSTFRFPLVNAWKRAAVAAIVTSERELPILDARLDQAQRALLIRDATYIAHALVRLDDRYRNLSGWQFLEGRTTASQSRPRRGRRGTVRTVGLFTSMLRCEDWATSQVTEISYHLDHLGHRPVSATVTRDLAGGVDDASTALGSAWGRLHHEFPSMAAMTSILRSNRLISASAHRLALTAGEADLSMRFASRAETYLRLLDVTENVSGNLGHGHAAVADMSSAVTILDRETTATREELVALDRAFDAVDAGLSTLLARGANERLFFVTHHSHMGQVPSNGIVPAVHEYVALTSRSHPAFFDAVHHLRPALRPRETAPASATSREAFRELLTTGFTRKRPAVRPGAFKPSEGVQIGRAAEDWAPTEPEIDDLAAEAVGLVM